MVEANPAALIADRVVPYQLECDLAALLGKRAKRQWFSFWR
jgi:hypothetical protein